jgi:hypothetical protein
MPDVFTKAYPIKRLLANTKLVTQLLWGLLKRLKLNFLQEIKWHGIDTFLIKYAKPSFCLVLPILFPERTQIWPYCS